VYELDGLSFRHKDSVYPDACNRFVWHIKETCGKFQLHDKNFTCLLNFFCYFSWMKLQIADLEFEPLLSYDQIQQRVAEVAQQLNERF
jgi:hypothetical protein